MGAEGGSPWQEMGWHQWQKARPRWRQSPDPGKCQPRGPPQVLDGGRDGRTPSALEVQRTAGCHIGSPREKGLGDELKVEGRAEPGYAPGDIRLGEAG